MATNHLDLQRLKLLCVDANPCSRAIIRTVLNAMEIYDLVFVDDASAILRDLAGHRPDILISEYFAAPGNGIELIRKVRQDPRSPDPHIPIVLLTTYTEQQVVTAARDAGANYTLAKPVSIGQFYSGICMLVESPLVFVRTATYFGPDRRRKQRPFDGAERRGTGKAAAKTAGSQLRFVAR